MVCVVLLALLSLCFFTCASSGPAVYYVTPTYDNCTVDETTLNPCYTINQLIEDEVLSSANESAVEMLLLPGIHLIENRTLNLTDFSEVVIRPWNEEQKVVLQCQLMANLTFQDIAELKLSWLHLTFCSLDYSTGRNSSASERSVTITECTFEGSKTHHAININRTREIWSTVFVEVIISYCKFVSNSGSIRTGGYYNSGPIIEINIRITETLFQGSRRNDGTSALNIGQIHLYLKDSYFMNNTGGHAIVASGSSLELKNVTFCDNSYGDSILYLSSSSATVDDCYFTNNSATAIYTRGIVQTPLSTFSNSVFKGNGEKNAAYIKEVRVTIRDCHFTGYNTALSIDNTEPSIVNSRFENNTSPGSYGGALYVVNANPVIINCSFINNSARSGGALYVFRGTRPFTIDDSTFMFNEAVEGGAIYCEDYLHGGLHIDGGYQSSNSATSGGFAYLYNCLVHIDNYNTISKNTAAMDGGAIYAHDSRIHLSVANITMANNAAGGSGGALFLAGTIFSLNTNGNPSVIVYANNVAGEKGGAIFVPDEKCEAFYQSQCFLQGPTGARFIFTNNRALDEGSILYGGLLDKCFVRDYSNGDEVLGIDYIKSISEYGSVPPAKAITSGPVTVCLCDKNSSLDCSTRNLTFHRMGGQTIDLSGTVVDQDQNPKPSYIRARYNESAKLGRGEGIKETNSVCTNLSYHVFADSNSSVRLILQPDGFCEQSTFSSITVNVKVSACYRGFQSDEDGSCTCDSRLTDMSSTIICDIDADSIESKGSLWIRYDDQSLKVHKDCPLDYCNETLGTISLADPDEQCANNRIGVICGACRGNYSIALGGSKCVSCNSSHTLIWLIPVFAVAGIALVAFLLICNLTISQGTLNGLIFYANVISITRIAGLQNCSIHPILSVFMAWINLDYGMRDTCFYSGMDTYEKTWL